MFCIQTPKLHLIIPSHLGKKNKNPKDINNNNKAK